MIPFRCSWYGIKYPRNANLLEIHTKYKYPWYNHELQTVFQRSTCNGLTTLIELKFGFFSFIYQINSRTPTYIKPNNVPTLHFPPKQWKLFIAGKWKSSIILCWKTSNSFSFKTETILFFCGIFIRAQYQLELVLCTWLHFQVEQYYFLKILSPLWNHLVKELMEDRHWFIRYFVPSILK